MHCSGWDSPADIPQEVTHPSDWLTLKTSWMHLNTSWLESWVDLQKFRICRLLLSLGDPGVTTAAAPRNDLAKAKAFWVVESQQMSLRDRTSPNGASCLTCFRIKEVFDGVQAIFRMLTSISNLIFSASRQESLPLCFACQGNSWEFVAVEWNKHWHSWGHSFWLSEERVWWDKLW